MPGILARIAVYLSIDSCANTPNWQGTICVSAQGLEKIKIFVTKQSSQHMYIVRGQEVQYEKHS